jgi:hypothetical protein
MVLANYALLGHYSSSFVVLLITAATDWLKLLHVIAITVELSTFDSISFIGLLFAE